MEKGQESEMTHVKFIAANITSFFFVIQKILFIVFDLTF